MIQMDELQARIKEALDRIEASVETMGPAGEDPALLDLRSRLAQAEADAQTARDELQPALDATRIEADERLQNAVEEARQQAVTERDAALSAAAAANAELDELRDALAKARMEAPDPSQNEEVESLRAMVSTLQATAQSADQEAEDLRSELADLSSLRTELAELEALRDELNETREAAQAAERETEDLRSALEALKQKPPSPDLEEEVERLRAQLAQSVDQDSDTALQQARAALEDEKMANAQLEERLKLLKARMTQWEEGAAKNTATHAAPQSAPALDLATLDNELYALRAANAGLEEMLRALREANAKGLSEPGLINHALEAEIASLRATRASESAEARAVLGALEPILSAGEEAAS